MVDEKSEIVNWEETGVATFLIENNPEFMLFNAVDNWLGLDLVSNYI